jgi:hypothetical protein
LARTSQVFCGSAFDLRLQFNQKSLDESYRTVWNAPVKDRLEDRLHVLVVSGKLDLKTAQHEIATDRTAAYKKYIGPSPPRRPSS